MVTIIPPRKLGRWQNRLERDVCAMLSQRDGLALIASHRALSAALAQAEAEREALREALEEREHNKSACTALKTAYEQLYPTPAPPSPPAGEEVPS